MNQNSSTRPAFVMLLVLGCLDRLNAARILIVPTQFKSHMMYVNAPGEELIKRGHEVHTLLGSNFPEPNDLQKLGYIVHRFMVPKDAITHDSKEMQEEIHDVLFRGKMPKLHGSVTFDDCQPMLEDEHLMAMLRDLKFDIALVDGFSIAPCSFLVPHVLGIPYIYISSFITHWLIRNPALPSFVPSAGRPYTEKMTFIQRLVTLTMAVLWETPFVPFRGTMRNYTLLEKYVSDPSIRTWKELAQRSELFFVTHGLLLDWPIPEMPNLISLEGMTTKPALPLSHTLEQFVNQAEHGVVVVSFGSLFEQLPEDVLVKLLKAFSQRSEHYVWRVDKKLIKSGMKIPAHIKVMSWLPQNDLLGHPKTRLFITHCGNNGQYEAVYHGVPMLGFPIFGDQRHNGVRIPGHGYGLSVNIWTITAE